MITVLNLYARRGSFNLAEISFEVAKGSVLTVMGPNGCGKTTLLECIAGLCKVSSGNIIIDGVDVTGLPPEKRRVGYVPADYALFPNMTVRRNIWLAFKKSNGMCLDGLQRIIRLLQIEDVMDRNVECLSSGQKQKAAIARALAAKPNVLLLDEPCSALDTPTREIFRRGVNSMFKDVFREFSIPIIYTTHDLLEASVVGDKIAVMNYGRIEQIGCINDVFESPASKFIAEFLGYNVLIGHVVSASEAHVSVDVGGAVLNAEGCGNLHENFGEVIIVIRPQDIFLSPTKEVFKPKWKGCQCNILDGIVRGLRMEGSVVKADVVVGDVSLKAEISPDYLDSLHVKPGGKVFVQIKASKVKVLPKRVEV
mgnify:FL=1